MVNRVLEVKGHAENEVRWRGRILGRCAGNEVE